jgi:hypothetical protein
MSSLTGRVCVEDLGHQLSNWLQQALQVMLQHCDTKVVSHTASKRFHYTRTELKTLSKTMKEVTALTWLSRSTGDACCASLSPVITSKRLSEPKYAIHNTIPAVHNLLCTAEHSAYLTIDKWRQDILQALRAATTLLHSARQIERQQRQAKGMARTNKMFAVNRRLTHRMIFADLQHNHATTHMRHPDTGFIHHSPAGIAECFRAQLAHLLESESNTQLSHQFQWPFATQHVPDAFTLHTPAALPYCAWHQLHFMKLNN